MLWFERGRGRRATCWLKWTVAMGVMLWGIKLEHMQNRMFARHFRYRCISHQPKATNFIDIWRNVYHQRAFILVLHFMPSVHQWFNCVNGSINRLIKYLLLWVPHWSVFMENIAVTSNAFGKAPKSVSWPMSTRVEVLDILGGWRFDLSRLVTRGAWNKLLHWARLEYSSHLNTFNPESRNLFNPSSASGPGVHARRCL